MYVCMYYVNVLCICVCMFMYVFMYVCMYVCMCVCVCVCVCLYVCMYAVTISEENTDMSHYFRPISAAQMPSLSLCL